MLMVTNRGRNKILRDVDRTRLEVKQTNKPVSAADSCAFLPTFPLRNVPVKAKKKKKINLGITKLTLEKSPNLCVGDQHKNV